MWKVEKGDSATRDFERSTGSLERKVIIDGTKMRRLQEQTEWKDQDRPEERGMSAGWWCLAN